MKTTENYMIVAIEECSELQKAISKAMRFGMKNYHPERPEITNEEDILNEYYRLQAIIELLQEKGIIKSISEERANGIKEVKRYKIQKYLELSDKIGTIC